MTKKAAWGHGLYKRYCTRQLDLKTPGDVLAELEKKNKRLREALEQYKDQMNWEDSMFLHYPMGCDEPWEIAKEALGYGRETEEEDS